MKLDKKNEKMQRKLLKRIAVGAGVAMLFAIGVAFLVFFNIKNHNNNSNHINKSNHNNKSDSIPYSEPKGHWVSGCGCACNECTFKSFEHADVQYNKPWHPGKCRLSNKQCNCPCEHAETTDSHKENKLHY